MRNQQPSILHSTYLYDNQTTKNFWKLHSKFRVTRWHQQSLLKVNRFFFSPIMLFQNFNTHTQTHQKFKRKFRMKPTVMTFLKKSFHTSSIMHIKLQLENLYLLEVNYILYFLLVWIKSDCKNWVVRIEKIYKNI